jgi:hypothetical protein
MCSFLLNVSYIRVQQLSPALSRSSVLSANCCSNKLLHCFILHGSVSCFHNFLCNNRQGERERQWIDSIESEWESYRSSLRLGSTNKSFNVTSPVVFIAHSGTSQLHTPATLSFQKQLHWCWASPGNTASQWKLHPSDSTNTPYLLKTRKKSTWVCKI